MLQIRNTSKYNYVKVFVRKCFEICSVLGAVAIFIVILLLIATFVLKSTGNVQIIYIERNKPYLSKTNSKFLSIGLDTSVIAEDFYNFNTTDVKLQKMVKYLQPAYLRIGGNLADKLVFNPNLKEVDKHVKRFYRGISHIYNFLDLRSLPNYVMTGTQWLELTKFAQQTNMEVLFDLNSLRRFDNGSWDYTNAESLIKFSNKHSLKLNWELGNEPNSFRHKFNQEVNATQMAKDFAVLRHILRKYETYKNSLLVGPDTTRPRVKHQESKIYLQDFLQNAANVIDAITWHQYYINGRTAKAEDFLNPIVFDYLKKQIDTVKNITKDLDIQNKPIWLGETSSAYGGGAPNLSNTFIGTFMWVDKLGLSAKMGINVVVRQSIFKGYYALLDDDYNPNPDWWISIIYKKLIGMRVVPNYTSCSPKVRLYCHCTKKSAFPSLQPSVTEVLGLMESF
ncbi:heparanase-like isoform X2 [Anoplophora glabripennis]|uniref:heparanase-like isoform X2 n=1 Tax=Anoplophora glabripennis TaxID=217634 RepID=UPI0008746A0D|nr:heparanase-like isoform X2 [Anoplophora glabripennis]